MNCSLLILCPLAGVFNLYKKNVYLLIHFDGNHFIRSFCFSISTISHLRHHEVGRKGDFTKSFVYFEYLFLALVNIRLNDEFHLPNSYQKNSVSK